MQNLKDAQTYSEILKVVTDNFGWCSSRKSVAELLVGVPEDALVSAKIYLTGTHKADGVAYASGNATVEAGGNATVRAGDSATVRAQGKATVRAWGNATVEAGDNATVEAWGNATVRAGGNATVRAGDGATVRAWGKATVRAGGNACVSVYESDKVVVTEFAIARVRGSNTVIFDPSMMKHAEPSKQ